MQDQTWYAFRWECSHPRASGSFLNWKVCLHVYMFTGSEILEVTSPWRHNRCSNSWSLVHHRVKSAGWWTLQGDANDKYSHGRDRQMFLLYNFFCNILTVIFLQHKQFWIIIFLFEFPTADYQTKLPWSTCHHQNTLKQVNNYLFSYICIIKHTNTIFKY